MDSDLAPYTPRTEAPGYGSALIGVWLLVLLAALLAAVAVVIMVRRRTVTPDLAGVSTAGALVIVAALLLLGPIKTMSTDGTETTCGPSADPAPAVAQMQGVPDDSVLNSSQRACRTQARWRTGGVAVAAAATIGWGLIMVGRRLPPPAVRHGEQ